MRRCGLAGLRRKRNTMFAQRYKDNEPFPAFFSPPKAAAAAAAAGLALELQVADTVGCVLCGRFFIFPRFCLTSSFSDSPNVLTEALTLAGPMIIIFVGCRGDAFFALDVFGERT